MKSNGIPPTIKRAIWSVLDAGNRLTEKIHLDPQTLQNSLHFREKDMEKILAPGDLAVWRCWKAMMELKFAIEDPILAAGIEIFGKTPDIVPAVEHELKDLIQKGYGENGVLAINYMLVEELLRELIELRQKVQR